MNIIVIGSVHAEICINKNINYNYHINIIVIISL